MRVVIDTNLLVSAVIRDRLPERVLLWCLGHSDNFPRDRKDAPFLMCAAAGKADYLITGDGDFSEALGLIATPILSVRVFAQAVAPQTLVAPEG